MKSRVLISVSSIALAFLGVACGSSSDGNGDTSTGGGSSVGGGMGVGGQTQGSGGLVGAGGKVGAGGAGVGGKVGAGGAGVGGSGVGGKVGAGGAAAGGAAAGGAAAGGPGVGGATAGGPGVGGATAGGPGVGGTDPGAGGSTDPGAGGTDPGAGGTDPGAGGSTDPGAGGTDPGVGGTPPVVEAELVTSANNDFWKEGALAEASGAATITVTDEELGTWDGLGGSFNEMGWEDLMTLSEADRAKVIELLFSKTDGANFNIGRIPMGASDYGITRYTLNETAGDYEMTSFSIAHDQENLIPFIKAAMAVRNDIRFFTSPWTPPTWMKTPAEKDKDNKPFTSAFDGGTLKSDEQTLNALALYFTKFIQAYAAEGINISALCPQNEPGWWQHYPSCAYRKVPSQTQDNSDDATTDYLMDEVIQATNAAFTTAGLTTEIWLGTLSSSARDAPLGTQVLNDPTTKAMIKGIGLQWEMIEKTTDFVGKGLTVWQTEHKCGNYPWANGYVSTQAPNDFAYAKESWGLIRDWVNKGVSAYVAWNMVLDHIGKGNDDVRDWAQNALIITKDGKYTLTPTYYVFRHLGQYVDAGATRVKVSAGSNEALAFKNPDGAIVTVIYSQAGGQQTLSAGGKTVSFTVPADGWATVNLQP